MKKITCDTPIIICHTYCRLIGMMKTDFVDKGVYTGYGMPLFAMHRENRNYP